MTIRHRHAVGFPVAILLLVLPAVAGQEEGKDELNHLTLKIRAPNRELVATQALVVLVEIRNDSEQDRTAEYSLSVRGSHLKLYVSKDGGEFQRYLHWNFMPAFVTAERRTLKAGEGDLKQVCISARAASNKFVPVFDDPGDYKIVAEVPNHVGPSLAIRSNVLEVRVRAPSGSDVAAATFLRETELAGILGPDAHEYGETKHVELLRNFLSKHANCTYATQARFALAQLLFDSLPSSWQDADPKMNARLEEIWNVLEPLASQCTEDLLADTLVMSIKVHCYLRAPILASKLLATFKEKCGGHPQYAELHELENWVNQAKPKKEK